MGFELWGSGVAKLVLHFCLGNLVFLQNYGSMGWGLRGLGVAELGLNFCWKSLSDPRSWSFGPLESFLFAELGLNAMGVAGVGVAKLGLHFCLSSSVFL